MKNARNQFSSLTGALIVIIAIIVGTRLSENLLHLKSTSKCFPEKNRKRVPRFRLWNLY